MNSNVITLFCFVFLSFLLFREHCARSILVEYKIYINYILKRKILDSIVKMKKKIHVFLLLHG